MPTAPAAGGVPRTGGDPAPPAAVDPPSPPDDADRRCGHADRWGLRGALPFEVGLDREPCSPAGRRLPCSWSPRRYPRVPPPHPAVHRSTRPTAVGPRRAPPLTCGCTVADLRWLSGANTNSGDWRVRGLCQGVDWAFFFHPDHEHGGEVAAPAVPGATAVPDLRPHHAGAPRGVGWALRRRTPPDAAPRDQGSTPAPTSGHRDDVPHQGATGGKRGDSQGRRSQWERRDYGLMA